MGGRKRTLRVLLAAVAIATLVAAVWLGVLGRQQAHRASDIRHRNAAAAAHNRALTSQLHALMAANARTQDRVTQLDDNRNTAGARLDAVVRAWNQWLTSNDALVNASNRYVDQQSPSGSQVRAELDPLARVVEAKGAAFQAAIAKFTTIAAKARRDLEGAKP